MLVIIHACNFILRLYLIALYALSRCCYALDLHVLIAYTWLKCAQQSTKHICVDKSLSVRSRGVICVSDSRVGNRSISFLCYATCKYFQRIIATSSGNDLQDCRRDEHHGVAAMKIAV